MRVTFIPDFRGGNSYQRDLAGSLSNQGVVICFDNSFRLFEVLRSACEHRNPDILHIHWTHPFTLENSKIKTIIKSTNFICKLALLKLAGTGIIWTVHNIADHEERFSSTELFFNKLLASMCDKLIVHCPSAKKEVMRAYSAGSPAIAVIPHGNYIGSYENVITASSARERLRLDAKDILFLYFGRIRPYKGVHELICAFKSLDTPRAKLLIAGKPINGEIASDILDRCKDDGRIRTVFRFIPDNEVQVYMNAADIIVLPYRDILTSGAVISAMSFGKPVIAPAIGCIADTLDKNGGFLYPKDGLLEAMRCALGTDTDSLLGMGRHNLVLAKQFGWDRAGKETYDVYLKILRGGIRLNRIRVYFLCLMLWGALDGS